MNSLMPSGLFRNGHFDFSRLLESAWFSPRKTDDFDGLSKECLSDCLQIFGVFDNFIGRTDFGTTDFTTVNGVSISRIQMRRDMQLIADVILTLDRIRCFGFGLTPFYPDSLQEPLHVQGDFMDARFAADRIRRYYSAIVDSPVIYPPLTNFFVAVVIGLYREDAVLGCSMVEYVTKSNPYHDEKGRFCSPSEAVTVSGTPGSERTADSAPPVSSLTEEQKEEYKKKLQCSDEVMSYIRTAEEAEVYVKAGLRKAIVNNRRCLVREIDFEFRLRNKSNYEVMIDGRSPHAGNKL